MSLLLNNNVINKVFYNNNVGYVLIGSPNINNGVVSNFTANNYLEISNSVPMSNDFVFVTKFNTTIPSTNPQTIIGPKVGTNYPFSLSIRTDGKIRIYASGTSYSVDGSKVYSSNTDYYIKLVYNSNGYSLYWSQDGINYNTDFSNKLSNNPYNSGIFLIGKNYTTSTYEPFLGSIDLNETYIKINGITWFNGKEQTSIDVNYLVLNGGKAGYTVIGSPIINNGVVSGFSSSNYVQISSNASLLNISSFEAVIKCKDVGEDGFGEKRFITLGNNNLIQITNGGGLRWIYQSDSNITFWDGFPKSGNLYIKAKIINNSVSFGYSSDGENYTETTEELEGTIDFTSSLIPLFNTNSWSSTNVKFFLNETYIKVNNEFWFNGGSKLVWANPNIYLRSSGTQYIDSGIYATGNTTFEIKYDATSESGTIFGSRTSSSSSDRFMLFKSDNNRFDYGNTYGMINSFSKAIMKTEILNDSYSATATNFASGTTRNASTSLSVFTTPKTLKIYAGDTNGTISSYVSAKIYYFKIYEEGVLIRHFVPVPENLVIGNFTCPSNGMFDIVNQQFYGNAGAGTFVYGKDN